MCRQSLRMKAKALAKKSTATERYNLLEQRRRLSGRISSLENKADAFMVLDDAAKWVNDKGKGPDGNESSEDGWDDNELLPEDSKLPVPSSLAVGEVGRLGLETIARQEACLRKGQINDALDGLRLALGEKSLLLRTEVRNSRSQRTSTRAWDSVNKQDALAKKHQKAYEEARKTLIALGTEDDTYMDTLQDITPADMKMSGDIVEENRVGQRSDTMAWFWRIADDPWDPSDEDNVELEEDNERLKECECKAAARRTHYTFAPAQFTE
jgi:hypothetical protein